jgi:16S rRNA (cytosine1402-N4)-methyltransferase
VPETAHIPVLLNETLDALQPAPGKLFLDGTLGRAGHARAILEASRPSGKLIGLDRDSAALEEAREKLAPFEGRFELHQANFAELLNFASENSCDGVLLDLGVSSPQLDRAERGFSFQQTGPLDMRMDQREALTAADIVNTWPEKELAELFWRLGEERYSRQIARGIVERRAAKPFETTTELAELIAAEFPRGKQKIHPATRVFQALRMEVNHELDSLQTGLEATFRVLKPGGRAAIITFHSLEDRIVKEWSRELARDYDFEGEVDRPEFRVPRAPRVSLVSRKPIQATEQETQMNPRSRSAHLRVVEKLEAA